MTENQRLKLLMTMLNLKTQREFADKLRIKQGSLSDIIRERNGMKVSLVIRERLENIFDVNLNWLDTGEGEPFIKKGPFVVDSVEGVPYYNISLAEVDLDNITMKDVAGEYLVNYRPFNDCNAYLPVFGDSMYPRYASGEIIAVKEVTNFEVLLWGEAYVVLCDNTTNNLRSIKLIHQHSDDSKLILRSSNPNFKGDSVISKSQIKALYIIKGKITRNQL